ncbi:hypothetical protein IV102_18055 [bacterium]|nr:hypothetical protein [bacterium]
MILLILGRLAEEALADVQAKTAQRITPSKHPPKGPQFVTHPEEGPKVSAQSTEHSAEPTKIAQHSSQTQPGDSHAQHGQRKLSDRLDERESLSQKTLADLKDPASNASDPAKATRYCPTNASHPLPPSAVARKNFLLSHLPTRGVFV